MVLLVQFFERKRSESEGNVETNLRVCDRIRCVYPDELLGLKFRLELSLVSLLVSRTFVA